MLPTARPPPPPHFKAGRQKERRSGPGQAAAEGPADIQTEAAPAAGPDVPRARAAGEQCPPTRRAPASLARSLLLSCHLWYLGFENVHKGDGPLKVTKASHEEVTKGSHEASRGHARPALGRGGSERAVGGRGGLPRALPRSRARAVRCGPVQSDPASFEGRPSLHLRWGWGSAPADRRLGLDSAGGHHPQPRVLQGRVGQLCTQMDPIPGKISARTRRPDGKSTCLAKVKKNTLKSVVAVSKIRAGEGVEGDRSLFKPRSPSYWAVAARVGDLCSPRHTRLVLCLCHASTGQRARKHQAGRHVRVGFWSGPVSEPEEHLWFKRQIEHTRLLPFDKIKRLNGSKKKKI